MRNLKPAPVYARTADGDQMDTDLRAIAADLRELHAALDTDIADRRGPHPRPPVRSSREPGSALQRQYAPARPGIGA
jgi:hypothetical protein